MLLQTSTPNTWSFQRAEYHYHNKRALRLRKCDVKGVNSGNKLAISYSLQQTFIIQNIHLSLSYTLQLPILGCKSLTSMIYITLQTVHKSTHKFLKNLLISCSTNRCWELSYLLLMEKYKILFLYVKPIPAYTSFTTVNIHIVYNIVQALKMLLQQLIYPSFRNGA